MKKSLVWPNFTRHNSCQRGVSLHVSNPQCRLSRNSQAVKDQKKREKKREKKRKKLIYI